MTREVIARYLSVDQRAAETPAAAVAMTPENYKFSYQGCITSGESVVYEFRVTPRKKRVGLLKGVLWLNDAGIAVRQSGSFVKPPSVLIKRMLVTRVLSLEGSGVQERVTYLSIETRIFGPAELVIKERPYNATSAPGPPE